MVYFYLDFDIFLIMKLNFFLTNIKIYVITHFFSKTGIKKEVEIHENCEKNVDIADSEIFDKLYLSTFAYMLHMSTVLFKNICKHFQIARFFLNIKNLCIFL